MGNFVGMILLIWLIPVALVYLIALFIGGIVWSKLSRVTGGPRPNYFVGWQTES